MLFFRTELSHAVFYHILYYAKKNQYSEIDMINCIRRFLSNYTLVMRLRIYVTILMQSVLAFLRHITERGVGGKILLDVRALFELGSGSVICHRYRLVVNVQF